MLPIRYLIPNKVLTASKDISYNIFHFVLFSNSKWFKHEMTLLNTKKKTHYKKY